MGDFVTFDYPGRSVTTGCAHMAVWLPLFSELCRLEGLVSSHLDVTQVLGSYKKSGETHKDGTAADVAQSARRVAELAREAGAPGSWPRGESWGQPSMANHTHIALDCPCMSRADYQIAAAKAGFNGLGAGGRAGPDYIKRPSVWRNYETGVAWMRQRITELMKDEVDMASMDDLRRAVREAVRDETRQTLTDDKLVTVGSSRWTVSHVLDRQRRQGDELIARVRGLEAALKAVGAQSGIDVQAVYDAAYKGARQGVDDEIDGATVTVQA